MIPTAVTRAVVAEEMVAVTAWAGRRPGWAPRFDDAELLLVVEGIHPVTQVPVRVIADLDGYRAVPPAWTFAAPPGSSAATPFPEPNTTPGGPGSIFHPNRIICAPWNRLAYAEHKGPHADWGGLANWTSAGGDVTKAHTLADMLDQIYLHLSLSKGMT